MAFRRAAAAFSGISRIAASSRARASLRRAASWIASASAMFFCRLTSGSLAVAGFHVGQGGERRSLFLGRRHARQGGQVEIFHDGPVVRLALQQSRNAVVPRFDLGV